MFGHWDVYGEAYKGNHKNQHRNLNLTTQLSVDAWRQERVCSYKKLRRRCSLLVSVMRQCISSVVRTARETPRFVGCWDMAACLRLSTESHIHLSILGSSVPKESTCGNIPTKFCEYCFSCFYGELGRERWNRPCPERLWQRCQRRDWNSSFVMYVQGMVTVPCIAWFYDACMALDNVTMSLHSGCTFCVRPARAT